MADAGVAEVGCSGSWEHGPCWKVGARIHCWGWGQGAIAQIGWGLLDLLIGVGLAGSSASSCPLRVGLIGFIAASHSLRVKLARSARNTQDAPLAARAPPPAMRCGHRDLHCQLHNEGARGGRERARYKCRMGETTALLSVGETKVRDENSKCNFYT